MRGYPQNPELIYKNFCVYSHMFKLQSSPKYSPFDAIHVWDVFSHCSKQFLNSSILMSFSAFTVFFVCFTSFTLAKHFSLRNFFIWGNKKRSYSGQDQVNEEGGALGVHAIFGQKLLDTQRHVSRCAHKSAIMKWANTLSLQKNSLKLKAASHNNASWYTDTDGFLEHT